MRKICLSSSSVPILATMAVGNVTAQASAGSARRSGAMFGSVPSVWVAAPSEGMLTEAPEKMPSTAAMSKPASQPISGAQPAPRMTIAAASAFCFSPCCRSAAKKPGPSCSPMAKTNRTSPNSLTKSSVALSTGLPKWPVRMPAKSTPAVPRPTPRTLTLPSAMPAMQTKARMPMAWATGWVLLSWKSQFMPGLSRAGGFDLCARAGLVFLEVLLE